MAFVLALIRIKTVNLTQLALGLNPKLGQNSNYEGFELCQVIWIRVISLALGFSVSQGYNPTNGSESVSHNYSTGGVKSLIRPRNAGTGAE